MRMSGQAIAAFIIRKAQANTVFIAEKPTRTYRELLRFDKAVFECAAFCIFFLRVVRNLVVIPITVQAGNGKRPIVLTNSRITHQGIAV